MDPGGVLPGEDAMARGDLWPEGLGSVGLESVAFRVQVVEAFSCVLDEVKEEALTTFPLHQRRSRNFQTFPTSTNIAEHARIHRVRDCGASTQSADQRQIYNAANTYQAAMSGSQVSII